jgi:hypothetical protein
MTPTQWLMWCTSHSRKSGVSPISMKVPVAPQHCSAGLTLRDFNCYKSVLPFKLAIQSANYHYHYYYHCQKITKLIINLDAKSLDHYFGCPLLSYSYLLLKINNLCRITGEKLINNYLLWKKEGLTDKSDKILLLLICSNSLLPLLSLPFQHYIEPKKTNFSSTIQMIISIIIIIVCVKKI